LASHWWSPSKVPLRRRRERDDRTSCALRTGIPGKSPFVRIDGSSVLHDPLRDSYRLPSIPPTKTERLTISSAIAFHCHTRRAFGDPSNC
jgi:hypothetical protein